MWTQVDVVEIGVAGKTVSEVVAWVDSRLHLVAVWTQEKEAAIAEFARRSVLPQGGDRRINYIDPVGNKTTFVFDDLGRELWRTELWS